MVVATRYLNYGFGEADNPTRIDRQAPVTNIAFSFTLPFRSSQESPTLPSSPLIAKLIRTPLAPKTAFDRSRLHGQQINPVHQRTTGRSYSTTEIRTLLDAKSSSKRAYCDSLCPSATKKQTIDTSLVSIKEDTTSTPGRLYGVDHNKTTSSSHRDRPDTRSSRLRADCLALAELIAPDTPLGRSIEAGFIEHDYRLLQRANIMSSYAVANSQKRRHRLPDNVSNIANNSAKKRKLSADIGMDVRVHNVCAGRIGSAIGKESQLRKKRKTQRHTLNSGSRKVGYISIWQD